MIKKWLGHILRHKKSPDILQAAHYPISLAIDSRAAEHVLTRLHQEGFEAYLVGGAVRDLLLGIKPKDFDVATNATPEQVHRIFRRSRIIGRRFQIVHVMMGAETIEVSTFRSGKVRQNEHGRIMRDNAYGTLAQDVMRRDFTCNALYYDLKNQWVIDYHHGIDDIHNKTLTIIGNPDERYAEDPVRMLRAARLSAKLGFHIAPETAVPIAKHAPLLAQEPSARLSDELFKILFSGRATECLQQLKTLGIHGAIHPLLNAMQHAMDHEKHIAACALQQTDARIQAEKSVSKGFILAAIFWPPIAEYWQKNQQNGQLPVDAMLSAIKILRHNMDTDWGISQRYSGVMCEIWAMQPLFDKRNRRSLRLLTNPRFRAAYDFLALRAQAGENIQEKVKWWHDFQYASASVREEMLNAVATQTPNPHKKRRRKPRQPKSNTIETI